MFRLGIDLGGTKIEGVVLDLQGRERFRKRIPTEQQHGYERILNNVRRLYSDMVASIGAGVHTFGIGTPGALSRHTGRLKNSNTVCMLDRPVKQDLERILERPVAIENDANCFAMAEAMYGAGRGKDLVFGVILGTGCGGGVVYKGELLRGLQAIAGEWGHMSLDPRGPPCYCGMRGCVETYLSGGGLENRYAESFHVRKPFPEIVDDYRNGDVRAAQFMQTFFRRFGRAMANVIAVLDPDVIVIGGGVSNVRELYEEGIRQTAECVFSDALDTPIVRNRLGDSAGVIGAALAGI